MDKADLHVHTNESDGLLSPGDVVYKASRLKLTALAITDHDTIDGIQEGQKAGKKLGIEVIPGIEFNTNTDNGELHILGYFIKYDSAELQTLIHAIKSARIERVKRMLKRLNGLGLNITLEHVLRQAKEDASLGRPHIARALVKAGYTVSIQESFRRYIGNDCPAYVERYKLEPEQAINIIKKSGGVPVLAHPALLNNQNNIYRCIRAGVQGIEVYHSKHTELQSHKYADIAKRYNLILTGGSDCHGDSDSSGRLLLGRVTAPCGCINQLKETATINRAGGV